MHVNFRTSSGAEIVKISSVTLLKEKLLLLVVIFLCRMSEMDDSVLVGGMVI